MAYVDQNQSKEKTVALIITLIIMVGVGYAFITGLAYHVLKKAAKDLNVIDIQDQPPPPPPETPPPPPKETPKVEVPPIVAPPPLVTPPVTTAPPVYTVPVAPPPAPPVITPTAPPAPPAPPPKPSQATAAKIKGDPNFGITNDDYPPNAQRNEQQGVTVVAFDVDGTGHVQGCTTTSSSGSSELDDTTCKLITRRARYTPAKDAAGNPLTSHVTRSIRWVLPKD